MLDEVDEDGLGPMQVVDNHDLRALRRTRLEHSPKGELCLRRRTSDHRIRLHADRDQHLDERPVGDPLTVGEAATTKDVGHATHAFEEVADEARLADPGGAEQREKSAGVVGDGILIVAPQPLTLTLTPHERRLGMARKRRGATYDLEEPKRLNRLGLALQGKRLDRLEENGIADEQARLSANQDLTGSCRLLQPGRDIDGVARHECLTLASDDDPAGVDPDARLEPVLADRLTHLRRCAGRTQRVVLVRDRYPEDSHDRVADELLDGATMSLEDDAKILEVPAHPCTQRLRIGRLPESRRTDKVAEENRDDLTLLTGRLATHELRAARHAKASLGWVLDTTAQTDRHDRSLRGQRP